MQGKESSVPKKRWTTKSGNITRIAVKEPAELMQFLLDKMGGMKRNSVKIMLSHRQVMVNGAVTTFYATALTKGDVVEISSARGNIELTHPKLKLLYEDEAIIVVEKKEGLLTVLTGVKEETTAFSILFEPLPHRLPLFYNRLDRLSQPCTTCLPRPTASFRP